MTFQCYAHADNTREYIMTSDAKRINSNDFMLVFLCLCLVYTLVGRFRWIWLSKAKGDKEQLADDILTVYSVWGFSPI